MFELLLKVTQDKNIIDIAIGHTGDFMKKVPTATCALRDR